MTPNRSSDQHSAPVRSRAVLTVALAVALAGGLAPAASAAPLPDGLGPCLGAGCPGTWDDPGNKPVTGHDSNINVYVGGNYLVREAAAEAEGRIVTLGNFDMDKRDGASPAYRVGVTDGGSDHLAVGANLTVAPGQRLLAEEGTGSGVVRYGGSLDGTVLPATVNSPDAAASYADLRGDLTDAGRCYAYTGDARRAVTGQALRDGSSTTFEGDGAARSRSSRSTPTSSPASAAAPRTSPSPASPTAPPSWSTSTGTPAPSTATRSPCPTPTSAAGCCGTSRTPPPSP